MMHLIWTGVRYGGFITSFEKLLVGVSYMGSELLIERGVDW